jgi:hypothetical protein
MQPLTAKAKSAIEKYVHIQGVRKGYYVYVLVDACLKADRMPREELYSYLSNKGFKWDQRFKQWIPKKTNK